MSETITKKVNQSWFEMQDLKKRKLDKSVWVYLRAEKSIRNDIDFGKVGFTEEFIGHRSLMIPVDKKSFTINLNWIGIDNSCGLNYLYGKYLRSDIYENDDFEGVHLVLNQIFDNNYDNHEWHLHQDLVINLGLKREGDIWVCPREGYVEVAKLERDEDEKPELLQIKSQFLKDYLCARNCGLYIASYFSRDEIFANKPILSWNDDSKSIKDGKDLWECRVSEVHEGGFPFSEKAFIIHSSRTDVDENEDVPDMTSPPTDANIKCESYERSFEGKKLYSIMAELWKYEWVNPAKSSPIVLGNKQTIDIFYIVDIEGNRESGSNLKKEGNGFGLNPI